MECRMKIVSGNKSIFALLARQAMQIVRWIRLFVCVCGGSMEVWRGIVGLLLVMAICGVQDGKRSWLLGHG